jgi:hypothetical protein
VRPRLLIQHYGGAQVISLVPQRCVLALLFVLAAGAMPAPLTAQAWLPEQGSFAWAATLGNTLSKYHYGPDGSQIDIGHTRTHTIGLIASYALSDRWLATAGIPYVHARYEGEAAHPTIVDDGSFHGTFTDFRFTLHYQLIEEPVALAPYVALVIPSHDYEILGHAAPGRGLEELWIGFFAGKSLHPWMPRTYMQARYTYAFVETVAGISHDRSNADLEVGYFVSPKWSIRALAAWQNTHGGIDVPVPRHDPLFPFHDQLAAVNFLNLGAGAAHSLSERTELSGVYLRSARGRNAHKLDHGFYLVVGHRLPFR